MMIDKAQYEKGYNDSLERWPAQSNTESYLQGYKAGEDEQSDPVIVAWLTYLGHRQS